MQKIHVEPFNLIGITVRTTNKSQAGQDIAGLWQKFKSENILEKIPNKLSADIYSMYTDYEGDYTLPYTTILGCKVTSLVDIPQGMSGKAVQGGSYAKTTTTGDVSTGLVAHKWTEIWKTKINRAYTADYEIYGQMAKDPSHATIEFYISIDTVP